MTHMHSTKTVTQASHRFCTQVRAHKCLRSRSSRAALQGTCFIFYRLLHGACWTLLLLPLLVRPCALPAILSFVVALLTANKFSRLLVVRTQSISVRSRAEL
jgi:hypothetical protein